MTIWQYMPKINTLVGGNNLKSKEKDMDKINTSIIWYVRKMGIKGNFKFPKYYMELPFGALVTIDSIELDEGIGYYVKYKNNHCVDMKDLPKKQREKILAMLATYEMWYNYHRDVL